MKAWACVKIKSPLPPLFCPTLLTSTAARASAVAASAAKASSSQAKRTAHADRLRKPSRQPGRSRLAEKASPAPAGEEDSGGRPPRHPPNQRRTRHQKRRPGLGFRPPVAPSSECEHWHPPPPPPSLARNPRLQGELKRKPGRTGRTHPRNRTTSTRPDPNRTAQTILSSEHLQQQTMDTSQHNPAQTDLGYRLPRTLLYARGKTILN